MSHAFITWDAALGRRMCPLATFGSRAPLVYRTRLVCVDPPRADRATLANADDVRGSIALVVRGGCSFLQKARRLQQAGAVAMIMANNTREEPFAMFTMAADAVEPTDAPEEETITIPCVMMCLYDVRELFKQYPPSVKTGILTLEIHGAAREQELLVECEEKRQLAMQQHATDGTATPVDDSSANSGGGWGAALKRTTTSLIKRWEVPAAVESPRAADVTPSERSVASPSPPLDGPPHTAQPLSARRGSYEIKPKQPVFAFVQWAISASEYVLFFAPLSDFCLVANNAVYEGKRVVCDPLMAHEETLRNAAELVDAIALVKRGACTFPAKLERIQRCGAAAAIVGNDDAADEDAAFVMSVDHIKVDHVTIPAVMVSRRVFQRLVEQDRPAQLRILCLSGEAAAECLARAGGQPIAIRGLATPTPITLEEGDDSMEPSPLVRLHAACRAGDHGACQRVLDETCDDERARRELVMARDQFQLTALHHACAAATELAGSEHIVTMLLRLGAQANARDVALNTPLHFACLRGHAACVKRLLTASMSSAELTGSRNVGGATPIHYAAMAGSTACMELLLSVNARRLDAERYCFDGVDEQDVDGATPLHVACAATQVDCVLYLVAANADVARRDRAGRTALQIACALVNEPSRSLQALHIVEKLMDAGAPVVEEEEDDETNASLAIDCVASKAIKRELEIAFLRREARQTRANVRSLTRQLSTQNQHIASLQQALATMETCQETTQRVASERDRRLVRQQKQIEQLQLQMKMLLTVLHSGQTGASGDAANVLVDMGVVATTEETETARAQDAALARDLGKKCCRDRQFALAQTYLERSLEVFPLPGVARLLEETKALRRAAESQSSRRIAGDGTADNDDGIRLRRTVEEMAASQQTKDALRREIAKLEAMDCRSSDYGASLKWIEWLLVLPWDLQDRGDVLTLEATVFDEIERLENERHRRREHDAARAIQRTFRERYAVYLLRRSMASARIQRVYRRRRARREQQRQAAIAITRSRQHATTHDEPERGVSDDEELWDEQHDKRAAFDVLAVADPRAPLHPTVRNRTCVLRGETIASPTQFVVLQLLRTDPHRRILRRLHQPAEASEFRVWRRWGPTKETARQSSLCGPYEDEETATARYERLLRESRLVTTLNDEVTIEKPHEPDEPVPSAWTWLRASAS